MERSAESSARERILDAACELIASDGIDEVRIARVANRARASTSLVHHYFSTREELLEQALLRSFELAADDRLAAGPGQASTATEGIAIAIEQCLPIGDAGEREWVLWVELWLRAAREPGLRPVAARLYRDYRDWFAELIAAGVSSGEFECDDPRRLADHALALFDGMGLRMLLRDPEMDLERTRSEIAAVLATELGIQQADLIDIETSRV